MTGLDGMIEIITWFGFNRRRVCLSTEDFAAVVAEGDRSNQLLAEDVHKNEIWRDPDTGAEPEKEFLYTIHLLRGVPLVEDKTLPKGKVRVDLEDKYLPPEYFDWREA